MTSSDTRLEDKEIQTHNDLCLTRFLVSNYADFNRYGMNQNVVFGDIGLEYNSLDKNFFKYFKDELKTHDVFGEPDLATPSFHLDDDMMHIAFSLSTFDGKEHKDFLKRANNLIEQMPEEVDKFCQAYGHNSFNPDNPNAPVTPERLQDARKGWFFITEECRQMAMLDTLLDRYGQNFVRAATEVMDGLDNDKPMRNEDCSRIRSIENVGEIFAAKATEVEKQIDIRYAAFNDIPAHETQGFADFKTDPVAAFERINKTVGGSSELLEVSLKNLTSKNATEDDKKSVKYLEDLLLSYARHDVDRPSAEPGLKNNVDFDYRTLQVYENTKEFLQERRLERTAEKGSATQEITSFSELAKSIASRADNAQSGKSVSSKQESKLAR